MSSIKNSLFKLIILGIFASSCSESSKSLTLAEQGVATGAVVGAGVGALIGSTAGEAGAGVVMGTIAGATSGGLIGSSMEGQEAQVDKQDNLLGENTTKDAKQKRSRLKSSRNTKANLDDDTQEESFLGRYIWNRAPGSGQEEKTISLISSNRPSGNKGLAAKYDQIKRPERTEEIVLKAPESSQTAQIRSRLTEKPIVELTQSKSKEDQLPKARVVRLPETESLQAQTKPVISLTKAELPSVKDQLPSPVLTKPKEIKTSLPLAKKTIIDPVKAQIGNATSKIENTKVDLGATTAKSVAEAKKAEVVLDEQVNAVAPKSAAKSVEAVQVSKCVKGQAEIKRAASSASDSDKVFYLRRAILSCPEESSLRVDLAKVYGKLGLKDDAKREFTSAIEIDPSNETAQEELSIMMLESSK